MFRGRSLPRLILRVLGLALVIFLLVIALLALTSQPLAPHRYVTADSPLIIAHRGGRAVGPENTLATFEKAVGLGVDVLEVDVRHTADGALVLHHDTVVDETTEGTGPVGEFTLDELKKLDAGYRWKAPDGSFPFRGADLEIATLEEAFAAFPEQRFNVELKRPEAALADAVCDCVRAFQMQERVLVASFHSKAVERFREVCPEVASAATPWETAWFFALNLLGLSSAFHPTGLAFQVPPRLVVRDFIANAGNHNVAVHVWTVNDPDEMRRLLQLGVDGLITDRPENAREIIDR